MASGNVILLLYYTFMVFLFLLVIRIDFALVLGLGFILGIGEWIGDFCDISLAGIILVGDLEIWKFLSIFLERWYRCLLWILIVSFQLSIILDHLFLKLCPIVRS